MRDAFAIIKANSNAFFLRGVEVTVCPWSQAKLVVTEDKQGCGLSVGRFYASPRMHFSSSIAPRVSHTFFSPFIFTEKNNYFTFRYYMLF